MKKNTFISKFFVCAALLSAALSPLAARGTKDSVQSDTSTQDSRKKEVVVYTYDSFAGEWGPGPELVKRFEAKTGLKLTLIDCGDAIQAFNRAVLEKNKPQADVIIGIDNNLADKAVKADILTSYKPKNRDSIVDKELVSALGDAGAKNLLTPYDYSHFAMIYDTESSVPAPQSLEDLTNDIYRRKIILMDPRTSTPGLGFLAWTVSAYGDKAADYWKALKPNILTMTSGWSEGWGMFLEGEAPLVISYTTSPAYNVEYDKNDRFQALVFEQGHVEQVEGYGLLKNAPNPDGAKVFMDYLLTEEAEDTFPLTQWMYPANKNVQLPKSYAQAAPIPSRTLPTDSEATEQAVQTVTRLLAN